MPDTSLDRFAVIPTPTRLNAHPQFTGSGVTIAMLDAGFQRHPDLTTPRNRILAVVDSAEGGAPIEPGPVLPSDWHGTQTSTVCAGNGGLSNGRYRGVACDAKLVLVKIGNKGRISDKDIARGIEWVIEHRDKYRIDIVNISAGGDEPISYTSSFADQAAEEAVRRGIIVVVAAGNAGFEANHQPMPPANSPSVITVGGYDDNNGLQGGDIEMYRSSFGVTVDGLYKPEIIAPAAWVAAPVLRDTKAAEEAEEIWRKGDVKEIEARKLVGPAYQHVDGTSFAAPIVASVVAQMVEANADLKPAAIKHILLSSAERLRGADLVRQGYGLLDAREAVEQARRAPGGLPAAYFALPHRQGDGVVFYFLDPLARSVALVGDFNRWDTSKTPFAREPNGLWKVAVPLEPGLVKYKFYVDGERWIEDPNNWMKIDDGYGGFASVLPVQ